MKFGSRFGWLVGLVMMLAATSLAYAPPGGGGGSGRPSSVRPSTPSSRPSVPSHGSFTGSGRSSSLPHTTGPIRSPAQFASQVKGVIQAKPGSAFEILRRPEVRSYLSEAAHKALVKQALTTLGVQLEKGGQPSKTLAEIRKASTKTADFPADVRAGLDRLAKSAERKVLIEPIDQLRTLLDAKKWSEVDALVKKQTSELGDPANASKHDSAAFTGGRAELREMLGEIRELGEKLERVSLMQTLLRSSDIKAGSETSRAIQRLDTSGLSPELRKPTETLRALVEVCRLAEGKWTTPPNASEIKATLVQLQRGLHEVPGAEPSLAKRILQEFAVKAVLEGHPAEYFKLMPDTGPTEHAGQLLRDLKAVALGEGTVGSHVVGKAVGEPAGEGAVRRAPAGLEPLVPEGDRGSWRPPVRESAKADLPPVKQAEVLAETIRKDAEGRLKPEKAGLEERLGDTRKKLDAFESRVLAPEQAERKSLAEVEKRLARRLNTAERVRARELLDAKELPGAIADQLADSPTLDEEMFLKEVARILGRPLTDEETKQAKSLREEGRRVAEVVDLLRS